MPKFAKTLRNSMRRLRRDSPVRMLIRILGAGCLGATLLFFFVGLFGMWTRMHVFGTEAHPLTWKEFVFTLLGGVDAAEGADAKSVLYSSAVRLLAAIVLGGLVTSVFCALADRIGELKLRGLLPPALRGHFVVFGFDAAAIQLIRSLLAPADDLSDLAVWQPSDTTPLPRRRRILLCTGGDVVQLRDTLSSSLPAALVARVAVVHADLHALGRAMDELLDQIGLADAVQAYVLGEGSGEAGSVANLALARRISGFWASRNIDRAFPVFVRLDARTPFEFQRTCFQTGPSIGTDRPSVHVIPFGIAELWARSILGALSAGSPRAVPRAPAGGFARIVIAGLSEHGEAMLQEAVRVCHDASGSPTEIVVVDPDPAVRDHFLASRPFLAADALPDIRIKWLEDRLESGSVRTMLRKSALDESCALCVVISFGSDDDSLAAALSLPEELYWHRLPAKTKTVRDRYRQAGATIWVRQSIAGGPADDVRASPRYANVRPFGMSDGAFFPHLMRESTAMHLNAVYAWPSRKQLDDAGKDAPKAANRIRDFARKWNHALSRPNGVFDIPAEERSSLLAEVLSESAAAAKRFREGAFQDWIRLPPHLRRANVYIPDFWGHVLSFLHLESVHVDGDVQPPVAENNIAFRAAFARVTEKERLSVAEHNRWMSDRALLGYRAPREGSGEVRDDEFLYHSDMVPFSDLTSANAEKDAMSLFSIPILLALEGFRLTDAADADKRTDNP